MESAIDQKQGWLSHVTVSESARISHFTDLETGEVFVFLDEQEEAQIGNSLMGLLVHLSHVTGEGHKGVKQSCVQLDQSLRLVDDAHGRLKVWSIHDS